MGGSPSSLRRRFSWSGSRDNSLPSAWSVDGSYRQLFDVGYPQGYYSQQYSDNHNGYVQPIFSDSAPQFSGGNQFNSYNEDEENIINNLPPLAWSIDGSYRQLFDVGYPQGYYSQQYTDNHNGYVQPIFTDSAPQFSGGNHFNWYNEDEENIINNLPPRAWGVDGSNWQLSDVGSPQGYYSQQYTGNHNHYVQPTFTDSAPQFSRGNNFDSYNEDEENLINNLPPSAWGVDGSYWQLSDVGSPQDNYSQQYTDNHNEYVQPTYTDSAPQFSRGNHFDLYNEDQVNLTQQLNSHENYLQTINNQLTSLAHDYMYKIEQPMVRRNTFTNDSYTVNNGAGYHHRDGYRCSSLIDLNNRPQVSPVDNYSNLSQESNDDSLHRSQSCSNLPSAAVSRPNRNRGKKRKRKQVNASRTTTDEAGTFSMPKAKRQRVGCLKSIKMSGSNKKESRPSDNEKLQIPVKKDDAGENDESSKENKDPLFKAMFPKGFTSSPSNFINFKVQKDFANVFVSIDSPTGKEICKFFNKSNKSKHYQLDIIAIEKIENPFLYNCYKFKKEEMRVRNNGHVDELLLYHGTKRTNIPNICSENLNWKLHSKNHMFGKGVNFSYKATYASHYCDEGETKDLLLCKVFVCGAVAGEDGMSIPPTTSTRGGPGVVYDTSMKDDAQTIVKFDDNEFYPLYRISALSSERID